MELKMTKIKFRIFNLNREEMYSNDDIKERPLRYIKEAQESSYLVVMQFTGFYDKDYNEIYEGDLLRYEFKTKTRIVNSERIDNPGYFISKIVFENGGYKQIIIEQENYYYGKLPSKPGCLFNSKKYMKIVGNIYENRK